MFHFNFSCIPEPMETSERTLGSSVDKPTRENMLLEKKHNSKIWHDVLNRLAGIRGHQEYHKKISSLKDGFKIYNSDIDYMVSLIFKLAKPRTFNGRSSIEAHKSINFGSGRCKTCDRLVEELKEDGEITEEDFEKLEKNHLVIDKDFPQYFKRNQHYQVRSTFDKIRIALDMAKIVYSLAFNKYENGDNDLLPEYIELLEAFFHYIDQSAEFLEHVTKSAYDRLQAVDTENTYHKLDELESVLEGRYREFNYHIREHRGHLKHGITPCKNSYDQAKTKSWSKELDGHVFYPIIGYKKYNLLKGEFNRKFKIYDFNSRTRELKDLLPYSQE